MRMGLRRGPIIAMIGTLLAMLAASGSADAYTTPSPFMVMFSVPAHKVDCPVTVKIRATVLEARNGRPASDEIVYWSLRGAQNGDRLNHASTMTRPSGNTKVKLTLGAAAGHRMVVATVAGFESLHKVTCKKPNVAAPH